MTDYLDPSELLSGKPNVPAGLRLANAGLDGTLHMRQEYYVTLFRERYIVAATVRKLLGTKLYGLTRVKTKVG